MGVTPARRGRRKLTVGMRASITAVSLFLLGALAFPASALGAPSAAAAPRGYLSNEQEREWILLTFADLKVEQTGIRKVKSSGVATLIMKKRGNSVKATVSVNPKGAASKTGKTKKTTVTLKWSKKYQDYRGKFSLTTGGVGPVVVRAHADNRRFTTTRRPGKQLSSISGIGPGTTPIDFGGQAVANLTVSPAFGRKIFVEKWTGAGWVRTQTITTAASKRTDHLKVYLPAPTSVRVDAYRVYAPESSQASKTRYLRHNLLLRKSSVAP